MAYAKTTPAQVITQLVFGASVGSFTWYSLRPKEPSLQDSLETIENDPAAALDAETRATTTGQLWTGLPKAKQDSSNSKLLNSSKNS